MTKCTLCNSKIEKQLFSFNNELYGAGCIQKILPNISFHPKKLEQIDQLTNNLIIDQQSNIIDVNFYLSVLDQLEEKKEQRQLEREQIKNEYESKRKADHMATIETLKQKDFSKIKNEFKLNFTHDIINQFAEKGYLSDKQRKIIHSWFNIKDRENYKRCLNSLK